MFNDFVAGGYHVDHVVAGPAGVFAVETKSWRGSVTEEEGEILVNGSLPDRAPVTQATREAAAVKAALKRAGWEKGDVMPVLCFASDTFADEQRTVGAVVVVAPP